MFFRRLQPASTPISTPAWRFQIPATGLFHQLLQLCGEHVEKLDIVVKRQLKDRGKLSLGGLFSPRHNVRKLRLANIHPSQFGALRPQGLLQQILLASGNTLPRSASDWRRICDFNISPASLNVSRELANRR